MRKAFIVPLVLGLGTTSAALGQPPDPPPPPPGPIPVLEGPVVPASAPAGPVTVSGVTPAPMPPASPPPAAAPAPAYQPAPYSDAEPPFLPTSPRPDAFCNRLWLDAEYLLWWTKGIHLPPLLTTGATTDPFPGVLGQPGTKVLIGDDSVGGSDRSGGRFSIGYWLGNDRNLGVDGSYFFLGRQAVDQGFASSGSPLLTRPYINTVSDTQAALRLAFPGRRDGDFSSTVTNELWGAEANVRVALWRNGLMQFDVLAGFRYLHLREALETGDDVFLLAPVRLPAKTTANALSLQEVSSVDQFATRNDFYGGQIGAHTTIVWGRLFMDLTGKVALGSTHEAVSIEGAGQVAGRFGVTPVPFGTLALPSNQGGFGRDIFTVVPEGRLTIGYQVTSHLRAYVGYTFLYTSRAVRPGDAIDLGYNPSMVTAALGKGTIVGGPRPVFPGTDSEFWAQGLDFGLEFRY
jgi:hypothetical protein